jgi:hypothetical protein
MPTRLGCSKAAPASWPDGQGSHFEMPFVYSSNGRPYLKQSWPRQSGTWFRDVRSPANLATPADGFHTPGLLDQLTRSKAPMAEAKLQQEGFAYLRLRDYQERTPFGGRNRPGRRPANACWRWPPARARRAPSSA